MQSTHDKNVLQKITFKAEQRLLTVYQYLILNGGIVGVSQRSLLWLMALLRRLELRADPAQLHAVPVRRLNRRD